MRNAFPFGLFPIFIEEVVLFDDIDTIAQYGIAPIIFYEPTASLFGVVFRYRQQDGISALNGVEALLQLTELLFAVGSPTATTEKFYDNDFVSFVV
jgi:hypothetical protein